MKIWGQDMEIWLKEFEKFLERKSCWKPIFNKGTKRQALVMIDKCYDCPYRYWEDDPHLMGGNGWPKCRLLGIHLDHKQEQIDVHSDCPLPPVG